MKIVNNLLYIGCFLAACGLASGERVAQHGFAGESVAAVASNIVLHAQSGDQQAFAEVLGGSSHGAATNLISQVLRSGLPTNYAAHLEAQTPTRARLNYHDDRRGCHFQVILAHGDGQWQVEKMFFCR
jgi:hypothetical protein